MIGKYTALSDAYLSVIKALQHACMADITAPDKFVWLYLCIPYASADRTA
jgi:CTP synthase (UTP-ammonia lyase)